MAEVHVYARDGLFAVEVEPADPAYPVQTFATYKAARGTAGGIRMVRGFKLIDHTETAQDAA